jgi:hypothetical protein
MLKMRCIKHLLSAFLALWLMVTLSSCSDQDENKKTASGDSVAWPLHLVNHSGESLVLGVDDSAKQYQMADFFLFKGDAKAAGERVDKLLAAESEISQCRPAPGASPSALRSVKEFSTRTRNS